MAMADTGAAARGPIDSFLTPEAMLTPGAAGALTMMITNVLGANFATPHAWTALALSFGFGLMVLVSDKRPLLKGIFYVFNSLIIFCVANGANAVGVAQRDRSASISVSSIAIFSTALAQPAEVGSSSNEKKSPEQLVSEYKELTSNYNELTKKIESAKNSSTSKDEVLDIVSQRDKIDQQRQAIFALLLKGADLTPEQKKEIGAPDTVTNNPGVWGQIMGGVSNAAQNIKGFFVPWKF